MSKSNNIAWGVTLLAAAGAYLIWRQGRKSETTPSLINNNDMKNYFADKEFTRSDKAQQLGINNEPDALAWQRIHELRDYVLNPARAKLGKPIYITSGYRSPELNAAVGGAANSQHTTGEAADLTTKSRKLNQQLFAILAQMGNFDQLIWEKGGEWVHVSFRYGSGRGQMLAYDGTKYYNINNNWQTAIA